MMLRSLLTTLLALVGLCLCPAFANGFSNAATRGRAALPNSISGGGASVKQARRRLFTASSSTTNESTFTSNKQVSKAPIEQAKVKNVAPPSNTKTNDNENKLNFFKSMDGIVFQAYLCNVVALSLPVILLPMAATEHVAIAGASSSAQVASTVAAVSSIATLGGAVGKFCNGFICKELGSYFCSKVYLAGLGICSLLFSFATNSSTLGLAYAGMEFFASMQWASLSVMLSNYYAKDKVKLAAALTTLGLSSTTGMVLAKTLGTTLCTAFHWKQVARFGAFMALLGSVVISRAPGNEKKITQVSTDDKVPLLQSIKESLQAILSSKLFWFLGLAHSMAFCTRGTERILGTFYNHAANLPQSIAGGFTLSITFGLMYGLVTGSKKFSALSGQPAQQKAFLASRYRKSFAATLGLALIASPLTSSLHSFVKAALVALCSGAMISNVAFQYYQFPAFIAKEFGEHKAVCISFLDGLGFLLSAPLFATCSQLVPASGWSSAWTMLAVMFGLAGALMVKSIGPVLGEKPKSQAG